MEVTGHADDRQVGIGFDRDLVAVGRGGHDAAPCVGSVVGGSFLAAHLGEDGVEALVALLGLLAVALDPLGHQVEDLRLEVARPPLGVLALAHEAGVGEHLDVLGDRLDGDVVGIGQLPHRGVADGEAGHHVAAASDRRGRRRLGRAGRGPRRLLSSAVQPIGCREPYARPPSCQPSG